jgi:hypothetical protein
MHAIYNDFINFLQILYELHRILYSGKHRCDFNKDTESFNSPARLAICHPCPV